MTALLLILVFLLFQTFVLLCCVAAGNDAASQEISDQEQMEFIREWKKITLQQPSKIKGCCNVLINLLHHITVISYCFSF